MTKSASDETTPLLVGSEAGPTPQSQDDPLVRKHSNNGDAAIETEIEDEGEDVPLPKLQIFVLCVARVIEPMAFFAIFPFVNKMIWETGDLDESDVGFYSGLIVCDTIFSPHSIPLFSRCILKNESHLTQKTMLTKTFPLSSRTLDIITLGE